MVIYSYFEDLLNDFFGSDFKVSCGQHYEPMVLLIERAYMKNSLIQHNENPRCFTILNDVKKRSFNGVHNLERINSEFNIYTKQEHHSFDGDMSIKGVACGYVLNAGLVEFLNILIKRFVNNVGTDFFINNKYKIFKTPISSKTESGNAKNTHKEKGLPNLIQIDIEQLRNLSNAADEFLSSEPDVSNVAENLHGQFNDWMIELQRMHADLKDNQFNHSELKNIKKQIVEFEVKIERIKNQANGFILNSMYKDGKYFVPIKYQESQAGRLFAIDYQLNLQNTPRIVRKTALSGCYDLDFENCHWSIAYAEGQKCGSSLPNIKYYLDNKNQVRKDLIEATGIDKDTIKKALIAIVYGSSNQAFYFDTNLKKRVPTKLYQEIGNTKFENFQNHSIVKNLILELKMVGGQIIEYYIQNCQTKNGFINNQFGKAISIKDIYDKRGKKIKITSQREIFAFIMQGAERTMLDIMIDCLEGSKIRLLQHDGLTYEECLSQTQLSEIETKIFEKTGIEAKLGQSERL